MTTNYGVHPCPKCGNNVVIKVIESNDKYHSCDWKIVCEKCGEQQSYAADNSHGRESYSFAEVVAMWNDLAQKLH